MLNTFYLDLNTPKETVKNCMFVFYSQQQTPMRIACERYNNADASKGLKGLNVIIHLIRANADITSKDEVSAMISKICIARWFLFKS